MKKLLKLVENVEKRSNTTSLTNNSATYYQTLEKVSWHLGLKKLQNRKNFKKT